MPLPRLHLFEFNDTPEVPQFVRETVVESLSRAMAWGRMLRELVMPFHDFVRGTGAYAGITGRGRSAHLGLGRKWVARYEGFLTVPTG